MADHVAKMITSPPEREPLPKNQLVDRRLYGLRSRNLPIGVWRASQQDFIGIRLKFNNKFLDTEEIWMDTSGTARAIEDLQVDLPVDYSINEFLGLVCKCGREVKRIPDDERTRVMWPYHWHVDDKSTWSEDSEEHFAHYRENTPLFEWLTGFTEEWCSRPWEQR